MYNNVTYPLLRHMLGYTDGQQLHHLVSPHDTWRSHGLTNRLAWVCSILLRSVCLCYTMVYMLIKVYTQRHLTLVSSKTSSSCILKCKWLILTFSMLDNIFPLHTKTHNYHLKYPNVLRWTSQCIWILTWKSGLWSWKMIVYITLNTITWCSILIKLTSCPIL